MKRYNLFISHSWAYERTYSSLVELLEKGNINFHNYSVPVDDPIHTRGTDRELENAIRSKIRQSSCVLILAGVYSTYSKWIKKEIKIAQELNKPIIAIRPWSQERLSSIVQESADVIVAWNTNSIVTAIKENA